MKKLDKTKHKKWWILRSALIMLAIVACGLFASGYSIYFTHISSNLHVWRPSVLPNGLSISKEQYKRRVLPEIGVVYFEYSYTLSNGSTIYQRTHYKNLLGTIPCASWGRETECHKYTSNNGLSYNVIIAKSKGVPFSLSIEASDETTDFYFSIPKADVKDYLSYDWSLMMNSLKPVDISHKFPKTVTDRCCGGG